MKIILLPKFALLGLVLALTGCATGSDPRDPFEPMNRGIYKFNDSLDQAVLKPVAKGYKTVLPSPVRTGVGNFFSNIDDALIAVNNLLQFKLPQALSDVARLVTNSTIGVAGLFDVATHFGLEKHNEDFGQTLGYWGVGDGPFLMLPFLGPSNVRDSVGLAVYYQLDPVWNLNNVATRNSLGALRILDRRARLLDAEKVLDEAALDPYIFLRDAYIQQRRNLIHDGNPPREKMAEEDETPAVKKAETEEIKPQAVALETAEKPAVEIEKKVEAAAPAMPISENKTETEVVASTETEGGLPALVAWLFSGNAAGWQE